MKRLAILLLSFAALASAQSVGLMPYPKMQFFDNSGKPLSGGLVWTYIAGTTTLQASYNASGAANPNPVVLDAGGRADIWLGANSYKIVLQTSLGATLWTVDGVQAPNLALYLPLAGGVMTGSITTSNLSNLGSTFQPFATLYLATSLVMGGTTVVDSARNVTTNNLTVGNTVSSNLTPTTTNTYDLGTTSALWRNLYLAGTSLANAYQITGPNTVISSTGYGTFKAIAVCADWPACAGTTPSQAISVQRGGVVRASILDGGVGGGGILQTWDNAGATLKNSLTTSGVQTVELIPMTQSSSTVGDANNYWGPMYTTGINLGGLIGGVQSAGQIQLANSSNTFNIVFNGTSPGGGIQAGLQIGNSLASANAIYPLGTTDLGLAGTQFRVNYSTKWNSSGSTFANLGAVVNGTFLYCSDCTIASPCAGGGTGALAKGLNSQWVCN